MWGCNLSQILKVKVARGCWGLNFLNAWQHICLMFWTIWKTGENNEKAWTICRMNGCTPSLSLRKIAVWLYSRLNVDTWLLPLVRALALELRAQALAQTLALALVWALALAQALARPLGCKSDASFHQWPPEAQWCWRFIFSTSPVKRATHIDSITHVTHVSGEFAESNVRQLSKANLQSAYKSRFVTEGSCIVRARWGFLDAAESVTGHHGRQVMSKWGHIVRRQLGGVGGGSYMSGTYTLTYMSGT